MMKLKSRRVATAVAAVAALAVLAGCSGAQPGGAPGSLSAWAVSGGVNEQLWAHSFDEWNKKNPDTQITYEMVANDPFKERIRTAIGAGTEPTLIFNWSGGTLQDYVKNGNVVDLTAGTEDVLKRVLPSVAQAGVIDGKVYAITNSQSQPVMMYYNKQLFDQVGIEVPTTWSELMDAVDTFKAAGITPFALGGGSNWTYLMWIQYLTDRIGGPDVFQAVLDGKKDAWSDPAITETLKDIQDLVKAGGFGDGFASVSGDQGADLALVYSGKAAMVPQGSWAYGTFKSDAADWLAAGNLGLAPFPTVEGGAGDPADIVGNLSNYWSVSANATPEQITAAKKYMNEQVFDDDYTGFLLDGGGVPPVAGLEDAIAKTDDATFLSFAYGMVRDAPHFQLSWDQALAPAPAQALLTNLAQIFLLQITPEQFETTMNATLGTE
jgi:raffinose/stachyose/melibiose transport system substrate-binding protein